MGFFSDYRRRYADIRREIEDRENKGQPPRFVTHVETDDWLDRARLQTPPKNRAQMIAAISAADPFRYARIRRDYKWLRKKMKRMGMNPDDARWLLL